MQKQKDSIVEAIKKLKDSPIFALTLGAKELCHSNFWKWLIDKDKCFAKVFFGNDFNANIIKVDREKKHMDIVLETESGDYVIENKLKSLPKLKQLEEYIDKYKSNQKIFNCGIITGIEEPFFDLPKSWKFLSYADILRQIKSIYLTANLSDSDKIVVGEYIEALDNMLHLIRISCDYVRNTMDSSKFNYLVDIKLDDVVKKLQADFFVHFLNENLKDRLDKLKKDSSWEVELDSGFTRKDAYVEIFFKKKENDDTTFKLGIQIQGNRFERYVCVAEKQGVEREEVYKKFCQLKWLEDYDTNLKKIFNKQTKQTRKYCSYVTDEYAFIYQYFNISDYSFDALKDEIWDNLNVLSKIIKDNKL